MPPRSDIIESMAIAAAAACLAHCIALPLIVAALPMLAVALPIPASFHLLALLAAVPTTLAALWLGYRHHGALGPLAGGGVGLALLAIGALWFGHGPGEVPVTIAGSLLIAAAHIRNWKLRRRAGLA
jgi:hypothetical protein